MAAPEKLQHYASRIRIFNGLTVEEVDYILHCGKIIHFREGQTVFHEGMLGSNLFVILSGKVAIYKKKRLIAHCKVGDAFGEMAVLNQRPRSATAAAREDVKLFTLDERQINEILDKAVAVKLLLNVIHVLSERLENANHIIAQLKDEKSEFDRSGGA
ncbi:MAG: cyclic nucleotide-binding domain-containing protein [Candidatus Hydrogenedentes bacterium]|nr:cyclic nucleotide-binding domain-containing protein [Candidatus Hydrogenedentota bacterium]